MDEFPLSSSTSTEPVSSAILPATQESTNSASGNGEQMETDAAPEAAQAAVENEKPIEQDQQKAPENIDVESASEKTAPSMHVESGSEVNAMVTEEEENTVPDKEERPQPVNTASEPLRENLKENSSSVPSLVVNGISEIDLDAEFSVIRICKDSGLAKSGMVGMESTLKWSGGVNMSVNGQNDRRFLEVYKLSANEMLEMIKLYRKAKSKEATELPTNKVSPIKAEKDDNENDCKLHLTGLPKDVATIDVREYFSKFGEVKDAVVLTDPKTKVSRGFGFVTFRKRHIAEKALKPQHSLGGKSIKVDRAIPRGEEEPSSEILVKGVEDGLSENDIGDYFSRFGQVTGVKLLRGKKQAFVMFFSPNFVDNVLRSSNRHAIRGITVDIKRARPTMATPQPVDMRGYPNQPAPVFDQYGHLGSRGVANVLPNSSARPAPMSDYYAPSAPVHQPVMPLMPQQTPPQYFTPGFSTNVQQPSYQEAHYNHHQQQQQPMMQHHQQQQQQPMVQHQQQYPMMQQQTTIQHQQPILHHQPAMNYQQQGMYAGGDRPAYRDEL